MCDFNQRLTVNEAIQRGRVLDDEGLYWIEEPVRHDDYEGYARIAAEVQTPIQTGENLVDTFEMADAIAARSLDFVMPDVQRIGGVTGWLRAAALAHAHGIEMSSHLFPEFSVHLLVVTPTCHWLEYMDWAAPVLQEPLRVKERARPDPGPARCRARLERGRRQTLCGLRADVDDCGTDKEANYGDDHHSRADHPRLCESLVDFGAAVRPRPGRAARRQLAHDRVHGALPPYAASGEGCWITDVEGDRRLDCLNNYTALMHGHAHPAIVEAATRRLGLRRLVSAADAGGDRAGGGAVRAPALGGAGTLHQFRQRGGDDRDQGARAPSPDGPKIAKFEGAYHGSYDYAEVSLTSAPDDWGRLAAPASMAYSRGTAPAVLEDVVVLPFNHLEHTVARIEREARRPGRGADRSRPQPGRPGPAPGASRRLREVTRAHGILLIFDEVISFRVGSQGAQGALGRHARPHHARQDHRRRLSGRRRRRARRGHGGVRSHAGGPPAAPHGGTFNANPVTMAAGLAAMRLLTREV